MELCSIGKSLGEEPQCHKTAYTNGKVSLSSLAELGNDKELLKLRSGCIDLRDDATVCLHHQKYFLLKYSFLQKQCCDPFNLHPGSKRRHSLRIINPEKARELTTRTGRCVKPGQKWCPPCVIKDSEFIAGTETHEDTQMTECKELSPASAAVPFSLICPNLFQTFDMGSKMSFSRGSSDQNTVSELTSVTPHPRSSIQAPSDCKQIPDNKRCNEDNPDSKWREELKTTDMTEASPESHPSWNLESDGPVNSEREGGTNSQQGEHMSSQVGVEVKPQVTPVIVCTSTTDSHGQPMEAHKKRGRPRKMKVQLKDNKKVSDTAGFDAVQHKEISTTIPLPACLENHNSGDVPITVDGPLINSSGLHIVSEGRIEDGASVLPKRKRGRPKKTEIAALKNIFTKAPDSNAPPASTHVSNINGPSRRLRSRGEQKPWTKDEITESDNKVEPKKTEPNPPERRNESNFRRVKRRRPKLADQQVPAKVTRLEDSQEASSVLSNDTGCGEGALTDKQVERNTDKKETRADGKDGKGPAQSRKGKEQQTEMKKYVLPHRKLRSQAAADLKVVPSEVLKSPNLVSPTQSGEPRIKESVNTNDIEGSQSKSKLDHPKNANVPNTEPLNTNFKMSSEETRRSVCRPPAVKTENIEVELDQFNPMSESSSPKCFQHSANTAVKSEGAVSQRITFRRKRGGKRRRMRISNVLLQSQTHKNEDEHEGTTDAQHETVTEHCGDEDKEAKSDAKKNVRYTKKGGKTLLKCGYCGRTFKFLSQFIIHQRIHTGERPFKCPECGKGFSKNSNLNLHLKTHRKSNMYQKCPFCKIKFSCSEYACHMKMHGHEPAQDSENNKFENDNETSQELHTPVQSEKRQRKVCQYCGKTFPFQSALIRHVRVHTGEKPYKCDICGKAFGQAYFLRVHELTHWSVKRYNCTRCEKSFTHYSNAKNHTCRPTRDDEDDPQPNRPVRPSLTYTCHICKNVFDHLQEFNSHMKAHTGAKLYRCLYCDKLFGVLSEFNTHRNQCKERNTSSSTIKEEERMSLIQYTVPALRCSSGHRPASPLTAASCETQKKQSQTVRKKRIVNLKKPFQSTVIPAHHLSHLVSKLNKLDNRSDPRKYLCPSCGRLFRHMGRLRAHMLTHAPGQSYTCACCGKTLANWKKLWHHQRIHRQRHGRFTCPQCGQGFRFVEPYKKHMSEHPEFQWVQVRPKKVFLPYQCEQCRCSFKTLDLLFSHQLCHSATQDAHKDTTFDLSIDDHSTQAKMFTLSTDNHIATLHPETEDSDSPVNISSKYPDPDSQESPVVSMISFVQNQSLDLDEYSLCPSSTRQDGETSHDRAVENALEKPITPLRSVKRCMTQYTSISNDGYSDGIKCAVCGDAYPAISDLYHHYLQHARGQV